MESSYSGGGKIAIRHLMPESKTPNARNVLYLVESLEKRAHHKLLPRLLVIFYFLFLQTQGMESYIEIIDLLVGEFCAT